MKSLSVLLALSPLCVALTQGTDSTLRVGDRLRIVAADTDAVLAQRTFTRTAGSLAAIDGEALLVQPSAFKPGNVSESARVPISRIILAERFVGRRRHPVPGALIGLGAGAIVGYLQASSGSADGFTCITIGGSLFCQPAKGRKDDRLPSAGRFGLIGAASGAIFGYFIRTERWNVIDLGRLKVQVGIQ